MKSLALTILLLPGALVAQTGASYQAPNDPVHWISDNPFRLYLIRGGDTVGAPIKNLSVLRDRWTAVETGFSIRRESIDIGLSDRRETDSLLVTKQGSVVLYNGATDYNEGEWDALLRLPPRGLEVGRTWSDTLIHPTDGPAGEGVFSAAREYKATRFIDSLGVTGIEVVATGTMDFRLSMWTDSLSGTYRWFDLSGPFEERYVFDPQRGQLALREWSMHLLGRGGDFDGSASDTVPAGLRSANWRYHVPAERGAALMEPMLGTDTTATFRDGQDLIFLHSMARSPDRLVESFRRADGLNARAEVAMQDGIPVSWSFDWVAPRDDLKSYTFRRDTSGLRGPDGARLEPPTTAWAIAEYGIGGTLVPSLESSTVDGSDVDFSVYRPTPRSWDRYSVSSRSYQGFHLFVLNSEDGGQTILIVTDDGMLIYVEAVSKGSTAIRVPLRPGLRNDQLQAAIAILQEGA